MGHLDSATALDAVPQPYLDDGDVQLYHGDVLAVLKSLPAGIAQTCVTSPPYWGLRDYGESYQIGLEPTPDFYVKTLVCVFREVWRVLRDDGTVWLNLGDSYASTQASDNRDAEARSSRSTLGPKRDGLGAANAAHVARSFEPRRLEPGLKPKDLVGIPWRVAFALQTDGWYLRSDIIWAKPNPMPESVSDRPTKAHEYLFLLTKRPRYFYDADAIREPSDWGRENNPDWQHARAERNGQKHPSNRNALSGGFTGWEPAAGRNRRSVWTIPTEPFPEAHFATYPQALVRPCILAGTSERGECVECGAPWVREVERTPMVIARSERTHSKGHTRASGTMLEPNRSETTGWRASCKCDAATRPQTVLDPFIGSGTTALVARNHARRCSGIDLSAEYLAIAAKRLQQLSLLGGTA